MSAALRLTVDHTRERKQFGRPIGSFQAVQHRLAELAVLVEGARWLALEAAFLGAPDDAADLALTHACVAAAPRLRRRASVHRRHRVRRRVRPPPLDDAVAGARRWRRTGSRDVGLASSPPHVSDVMTSLLYDDVDAELAASVRRYCTDRLASRDDVELADGWWTGLGELGVLGLATPEGGGGVSSIAAAMEELGRANAPGPLAATFLATQLVDRPIRQRLTSGEQIVAVGSPPLLPWLPVAGVVIILDGGSCHLATVSGDIEAVDTLGGEPWGRGTFERVADLGPSDHAVAVADVATGAYLAANGARLLEDSGALRGRPGAVPPTDRLVPSRRPPARRRVRPPHRHADTGTRGGACARCRRRRTRSAAAATARLSHDEGGIGRGLPGPPDLRCAGLHGRRAGGVPISPHPPGQPGGARGRPHACGRAGRSRPCGPRCVVRSANIRTAPSGSHTTKGDEHGDRSLRRSAGAALRQARPHRVHHDQPTGAGEHTALVDGRADQGDLGRGARGPVDPVLGGHGRR